MPFPTQIDNETLLRRAKPGIPGVFYLSKIEYTAYPVDHEYHGRCDNYSFASVRLAKGTEYEDQDFGIFKSETAKNTLTKEEHGAGFNTVKRYHGIIDCAPDFAIVYIEFNAISKDKSLYDLEKQPFPSTMWLGRSMFHLLKNMREWQFAKEYLDPNHPMAIYSDKAMKEINPPQSIIDEIDGWPHMHLGKFLHGDPNYKSITYPFPEPSRGMEDWIVETAAKYRKMTREEIIAKL